MSKIQMIRLIFTIIPSIVSIISIWRAIKQHYSKEQFLFLLIMECTFLIGIGGVFETVAKTDEGALFAKKISYIGRIFILLLMPEFVAMYGHYKRSKIVKGIMWFFYVLSLGIILTTDINHLFYKRYWMEYYNGDYFFRVEEGLLYPYLYGISLIVYSYIFYIVIRGIISSKYKEERQRFFLFLIGNTVPLIVLFMYRFHMTLGIDIIPLSVTITVICYLIALEKYYLFDIEQDAKGIVLDNSEEGVMVLDKDLTVVYANKNIFQIAPEIEMHKVLPPHIYDSVMKRERMIVTNGKDYEILQTPLFRKNGKFAGRLVEIWDITDKIDSLQEMERLRQAAEQANHAKSSFLSNMSHEIRTPMNAIVGMTEILLREDLPEKDMEYLENIRSSGSALLSIINDILDFSKIEVGKFELLNGEYEMMSLLSDLSMIFLNRIGEKPIELIFDIDSEIPDIMYGDAIRIRQVIINLVNNAIKFTESGCVKFSMHIESRTNQNIVLAMSVKDTGVGIRKEDIPKLFEQFQQIDNKGNMFVEGTGLGLAIAKQFITLMDGAIDVKSEYGKGTEFSFTINQKVISEKPAAKIKEEILKQKPIVGIRLEDRYIAENIEKLCQMYGLEFCNLKELETNAKYIFTDSDNVEYVKRRFGEITDVEIILLCNPMKDRLIDNRAVIINKPIFTLSFCQVLNREENHERILHTNDDFDFIAPDAKILVVDDTVLNLRVAQGLLQPLQLQIDTAENGKEALEKIQSKQYDLIFMDHKMPVMDGIETTKRLRAMDGEYYRNVPVIALSANAIVEARDMFLSVGMNDFVSKPIEMKNICSKIKKWLRRDLIIKQRSNTKTKKAESSGSEFEKYISEGIDLSVALTNSGGEELLKDILLDFYDLIDYKSDKVEEFLKENNIKEYTILVHALKSTCKLVGALELSDQFKELEECGEQKELEKIEVLTPQVLEHFRKYKKYLADFVAAMKGETSENVRQTDTRELIEILTILSDSITNCDLDMMDNCAEQFEKCTVPKELDKYMKDFKIYVRDVDMENVNRLAREMIEVLNKLN